MSSARHYKYISVIGISTGNKKLLLLYIKSIHLHIVDK